MRSTHDLRIEAFGECELVVVRTFDAPQELVFDAMTRPELLKRWFLGPPGWELVVCEVELKVPGKMRYVWKHQDGREMGMGGLFREIVRPKRLVYTESFDEHWYSGEAVNTATLVEQGGKTIYRNVSRYESREVRDGVLRSGMEKGIAPSYDRLDAVLKSLQD